MRYYLCMTVHGVDAAARTFEQRVTGEIRAEMARQRVTNAGLAHAMRRSKFWVGDRLNGRTRIEVRDLQSFADALGVPVERFLIRYQARTSDYFADRQNTHEYHRGRSRNPGLVSIPQARSPRVETSVLKAA